MGRESFFICITERVSIVYKHSPYYSSQLLCYYLPNLVDKFMNMDINPSKLYLQIVFNFFYFEGKYSLAWPMPILERDKITI